MNITMNELLLKKVKFGAEPASNEPEAQAPAESNPEKGMNALTFMGIKNLMSNPKLAQEVGVPTKEPEAKADENSTEAKSYVAPYSSNIAFQGGKSKLVKGAVAAAMTAGALFGATSCTEDNIHYLPEPTPTNVTVNVSQTVNVDLSAFLSYMQNLMDYLKSRDAEQSKMWQQLFTLIMELKQQQQANHESDAQFQKELLKMLQDNFSLVQILVQASNDKQDQALLMLNKIMNSNLSDSEKLNMIIALLTDIKNLTTELVKQGKQAAIDRAALLAEAKKSNITQQGILNGVNQFNNSMKELIMKIQMVNTKLEVIDADINTNANALMEKLGMSVDELAELLRNILGYEIANAEIQKMNAFQIINLLKLGNEKAQETNDKLNIIIEKLSNGNLSADELRDIANQIIDLLSSIDAKLSTLIDDFAQLKKDVKSILNNTNSVLANQEKANSYLSKMYNIDLQMLSTLNSIDNKTANIEQIAAKTGCTVQQIYDYLQNLGYSLTQIQNMNAQDIINAINANTEKLNCVMKMLSYIAQLVKDGNMAYAEGNAIIIDLLNSIDANVADIKAQLKKYLPELSGKIDQILNKQGEQTVIMNQILAGLDNGMTKEQAAMLINYAAESNANLDRLVKIVCALNQNVQEGFNMTNAQLKAILDAIKAIDTGNIDLSGLEAMIKELLEVAKESKNILTNMDIKLGLINVSQNVIISKMDDLAAKQQDYNSKLNTIISLLNALNNKPGYDDAAVVAKLNEVIEILLTHQFCNCNCSGSGNGGHEGIVDDIINCLMS